MPPRGGRLGIDGVAHEPDEGLGLLVLQRAKRTWPPPGPSCQGTAVPAGSDLVAAINAGAPGETFCIAAGTFDVGSASVTPKSGMKLIGAPVERDASGALRAPTRIKGTGTRGIIAVPSEGG